jgi:hypothetical protein
MRERVLHLSVAPSDDAADAFGDAFLLCGTCVRVESTKQLRQRTEAGLNELTRAR